MSQGAHEQHRLKPLLKFALLRPHIWIFSVTPETKRGFLAKAILRPFTPT